MHVAITARRLFAVTLLTIVLQGSGRAIAQEATPSSALPENLIAFEIYPKGKVLGDFFEPSIEAGDTADLVVVLANTGNVIFEGRTYAIDAFTEVNGGFAVAESGTPEGGVTTWLDYPEEVYTIDPGEGVERTFSVTVPSNSDPGEYITSLIFENAEAQAVEGSENFDQITRFAVPILITVPGPIEPSFSVGDVALRTDAATTTLDIPVTNTGNIRVRPVGTIHILDSSEERIYSAPVSMGTVFARDSTSFVVPLPDLLDPGKYEIRVDLTDPEREISATGSTIISVTTPSTPAPPPPIQIVSATGTPQPDAENVQFLEVFTTIENVGEPVDNVQVVLRVSKDGEPIEDYPIASSLGIPVGTTEIEERYIPATGWSPGTWEFTLSLEVVDPGTGVARVLITAELPALAVP